MSQDGELLDSALFCEEWLKHSSTAISDLNHLKMADSLVIREKRGGYHCGADLPKPLLEAHRDLVITPISLFETIDEEVIGATPLGVNINTVRLAL